MKKLFTCQSFLDFQFVSDPHFSPDGKHIAFIAKKPNIKTNGYDSALYLTDGSGKVKKMTSLGPVSAYSWEDENTILFSGVRDEKKKAAVKEGEEITCYYELDIRGGEAREAFCLPIKAGKAEPLGDGKYALTATFDNERPDVSGLSGEERKKALASYINKGYEHITEVPYTANGAGFTSKKRTRIYLYDRNTDELTALTEPLFNAAGLKAQGKYILYVGQHFEDVKSLKNAVWLYNTETGENKCLLEENKYLIKGFELYGDCAVLNMTEGLSYGNGENGDFYKLDLKTGERKLFVKHDKNCIGNTVTTDAKLGAGSVMKVDKDILYFTSTVEMDALIEAIDLKTGESKYLTKDGAVDFIDVKDGRLICTGFFGMGLEELYEIKDGTPTALTHFNDFVSEEYEVSKPEFISIKGSAPWAIEGYVLKPAGYEPGKKYPAVLSIHGGPRLTYGPIFMHQMQLFASEGYFVFFCNPRGAEGRGNEFADIRKRFGDIDFTDLMEFTDAVLEKYKDIDEKRLAVEGGSYGGFMTNWIIGHTNRFAAACAQRSIANWTGMEGTTDIGYYFCKGQTGASHMDDHELQWRQSPLSAADKCVTPTLFIHGEKDYRCWIQEAFQMFAALKRSGCPAKLCLFEGENHELSRSGRPKQRLKRLEEMCEWFDIYLKGNAPKEEGR